MGTSYFLVDEKRHALDIDKFEALWWVASGRKDGVDRTLDRAGYPVTVATVREAGLGWKMHALDGWIAPLESARLAVPVERWVIDVAGRGPVRIVEARDAPWGDREPNAGWGELHTLYVHPVTHLPEPPFKLWTGRWQMPDAARWRALADQLRAELVAAGLPASSQGRCLMVRASARDVVVQLGRGGVKPLTDEQAGLTIRVVRATIGTGYQLISGGRVRGWEVLTVRARLGGE